MKRISIDLPDGIAKLYESKARSEKRDRKSQIEFVLVDYATRILTS